MALFEIASLGTFAKLLLAARKLAEGGDGLDRLKALADLAENGKKFGNAISERNLGPLAARIEADCEAAKAAFGREPQAEDAWNIFQMVAPVALSQSDRLAVDGLQRAVILDSMIRAIDASEHARVFRETDLPETYFRAVMDAALKAMLADADFVDKLMPQLWRESLQRHGVALDLMTEVRDVQRREASLAKVRHQELLAHFRASDEARRLSEAGITEGALIELVRRVAKDVDDLNAAWRELQNAIEVAIRVQAEGRLGSNLGDFVDEVLRRVAGISAQGDYDAAAAEIDAALGAEAAEHKARRLRLLEAGLEQDRLRRNAKVAAQRVVQMAEVEAEGPLDFKALRAVCMDWADRGRDMGLLFDQEVSIELALLERALAQGPGELGTALNDLGISLQELGQREPTTARLEQAVATFRAARKEWTRDRVPLGWAMTQMNLGNALQSIGQRETGTIRLKEAVSAYHLALQEFTRDRVPQDWAKAKMNLGAALRQLGEREAGTARLEKAVAAYRAALEELTRERVPLEWAGAQMNLGNALRSLGERVAGTARLEEAVTAYRETLLEWTRERVPMDWGMTQMNLGISLWTLGAREPGTERLEEAVVAFCSALQECTYDRVPLEWASVKGNLAGVEVTLFDKTSVSAHLDTAESHMSAARKVFVDASDAYSVDWAEEILADIVKRRR